MACCYGLKVESWPLVISANGCKGWETFIAEAPLWEPLPSSREAMSLFTYILYLHIY